MVILMEEQQIYENSGFKLHDLQVKVIYFQTLLTKPENKILRAAARDYKDTPQGHQVYGYIMSHSIFLKLNLVTESN